MKGAQCPHSFISLDPLGAEEACVLCWTGRIMLGTFQLTPDAIREFQQGVVLIPTESLYFTGEEPLWLRSPRDLETRGRVVPLQEYISQERRKHAG